jgi:hypothetical protein
VDVSTDHEIRIDGEHAWCETCGWTDETHDYYPASARAFLHFSDPTGSDRGPSTGSSLSWTVCEFCEWPDRAWPAGRPGGDLGVSQWPHHARWEWDIRGRVKGWVLACDEHEHLGPAADAHAYKLLIRSG